MPLPPEQIFDNGLVIVLLAVLSLTAWIYLIALHGRFWHSKPEAGAGVPSGTASVVAIVPARDEAAHILKSIGSLLAQDYRGPFSVVVVDDNSTDGTGVIAASLASAPRLEIVAGQPLPQGWTGKLWAIQQGLIRPAAQAADYLLLTDADIEHEPAHLSVLVSKAESAHLDLVSEMVHLHCETVAERALIPAFIFFFQMLYPFARVNDSTREPAAAAGGTILVRREAMDRIDGVSGFRGDLIDDCALARTIKRAGGRIWLGHSSQARSVRVSRKWSDIWNMIARTAYVQLRFSPLLLLGCLAGLALLYGVPPLLALCAHGFARLLGLLAWAAMALAFQPTLHRYRRAPWWGIALPPITLFYLSATIASALRHHFGRGGDWKKRFYSPGS